MLQPLLGFYLVSWPIEGGVLLFCWMTFDSPTPHGQPKAGALQQHFSVSKFERLLQLL